MGLSDGRKSFPIGLAVLIQYQSVTSSHPATQPRRCSYYALTLKASSAKSRDVIVICVPLSKHSLFERTALARLGFGNWWCVAASNVVGWGRAVVSRLGLFYVATCSANWCAVSIPGTPRWPRFSWRITCGCSQRNARTLLMTVPHCGPDELLIASVLLLLLLHWGLNK